MQAQAQEAQMAGVGTVVRADDAQLRCTVTITRRNGDIETFDLIGHTEKEQDHGSNPCNGNP